VIIELKNISKTYDGKKVLEDFNLEIEDEHSYVVTGTKGCGKTTLFRIILGLESADTGTVKLLGDYKYPYINSGTVFQDDRLCEDFTALDNVVMVSKKIFRQTAREELLKLLPEEAINVPVKNLTPLQRRMVVIARACCIPNDVLIMDEPLAGLKGEDREKAIRFIRDKQGSGPLFMTASEDELEGLEFARVIKL
jgi:NitT/TauT family transport system ATP-binding protein